MHMITTTSNYLYLHIIFMVSDTSSQTFTCMRDIDGHGTNIQVKSEGRIWLQEVLHYSTGT